MIQGRAHQRPSLAQVGVTLQPGVRGQPLQHVAGNRALAARLRDHETMHAGAEMVVAIFAHRLPGVRLAVEFRSPKWLEGDACEPTLEWLEDQGLGFVCVDGPLQGPRALPAVSAVTSDVGVVRFVGRRNVDDEPWTWPYRYSAGELESWVTRLSDLASSANEVHVLMDNCWGSDAVDNAAALADLLAASQPGAGCTTEP